MTNRTGSHSRNSDIHSNFKSSQGKRRRKSALKLNTALDVVVEQLESRTLLSVTAGSLDPAFNSGGKLIADYGSDDTAQGVAIDAHNLNDIVVAGGIGGQFAVSAYSPAGAMVTSAPITGLVGSAQANAVTIDSSGRILVAGTVDDGPGAKDDFLVARYTLSGTTLTLDTSFGGGLGYVTTDIGGGKADVANAFTLSAGGDIIVAGQTGTGSSEHAVIAAYTSSGLLDSTFFGGTAEVISSASGDSANGVTVDSGGNVVAVGQDGAHAEMIFANASGSTRYTIDLGTGDNALAVVSAGGSDVYVAGTANNQFVLAKVDDSNGSVLSETTTSIGTFAQANSLAVQSNGKIVAGGFEIDGSGVSQFALARYDANLTLDSGAFGTSGVATTDFSGSDSANSVANGVAIQPDGQIVAAGMTEAGSNPGNVAIGRYVADNAPVAANSSATFTSIAEGDQNSGGDSVAALAAQLGVSDVDGDTVGLAITGLGNPAFGTWEYSTDSGAHWTAVGAVSDAGALVLGNSASNLIRFVPVASFSSTTALTVRAWDQTQAASGTIVDVTGNAGANLNSFSDATYSANLTVTASTATVFVDSAWTGFSNGESATDSLGATHTFGLNAFATVQDGVTFVNSGGTVDVDGGLAGSPLTYGEAVAISQPLTLSAYGAATATITAPGSASNVAVISVAAANVTIEGLDIVVDQPNAAAGIAAVSGASGPNVFDGLTVLNNIISTTGSGGKLNTPFGTTYSIGIAALANGAGVAPTVTISGNTILPNGASILKRAIWVNEAEGTIGGSGALAGNTAAGSFEDVLDAFARGATTLENNTFDGVGVTITEPNASAPIGVLNNQFTPQNGLVDDAGLVIKHNYNATSPVTINGNVFTVVNSGIGILSGASIGVSVSGNSFSPVAGATNTVDIDVDTFIPSGSQPSAATLFPNSISITGNSFDDATAGDGATAIRFADDNAGAISPSPDFGAIAVGGAGALANTFGLNLTNYITLAAPGASTAFSLDGYSTPNAGFVTPTIDAAGNHFAVSSGDGLGTYTRADYFEIEDKIVDGIDSAGAGLVRINAGSVYVSQVSENTNLGAIGRGVGLASSGDTIYVQSGLFQENVVVNKSVQLLGANDGVAGSSGGRSAETEILTNGNQSAIIQVTASHVTVDGFYLEGDDPAVAGGALGSGADSNALYGVLAGTASSSNPVSNVTVQNNVVKDVYIGVRGDGPTAGSVMGSVITNNWFDSIGAFDFGYAVSLRTNFYADVTDNLMTRVWTGVHLNNFYQAGPASWNISGNTISDYADGIWYNLQYQGATHLTANGNSISAAAGAVANNIGLLMASVQDTVGINFTNNTITGADYGVIAFNTSTSDTVTLDASNSIVNPNVAGVYLTDTLTFNPIGTTVFGASNLGSSSLAINGLQISGAVGIGVEVDGTVNDVATSLIVSGATIGGSGGSSGVDVEGAAGAANVSGTAISGFATGISDNGGALTVGSGDSVSGGTTGVSISGASASVAGNTLGNIALVGQSGDYLTLGNGALGGVSPTVLDATNVNFDNIVSPTLAQYYGIEDKVSDYLDDPTLGYAQLNPGNVYVAQSSETANAGAVQRGVNVAVALDVVNLQAGTYVGANVVDSTDGPVAGVLIDKAISLIGPNAAFDPQTNLTPANAQAILEPGSSDPALNAQESVGIDVVSSGVTIEGITVSGSNDVTPGFVHNGGVSLGGVAIDAAEGIVSYRGVGNITVQGNIIEYTDYTGVNFYNYDNGGVATSGNSISNNLIANLSDALGFGVGVLVYNNFYANVDNNVISNAVVGVQTGNFYNANPGGAGSATISNNTISASGVGIFYNLMYGSSDAFAVSGNTISAVSSAADAPWDGVLITSIQGTTGATFTNNVIDGSAAFVSAGDPSSGYVVWNTPTTASLLISGGSVSGVSNGVWVNTFEAYQSDADATQVTISGVSISASAVGVLVEDSPQNAGHPAVSAIIDGDTSITTGGLGIGIEVSGANASATISGNLGSIYGNAIGIDVSGGSAAISGNHIYDNGVGIEFAGGGSGSVDGNDFTGATANGTDLFLDTTAGAVSVGDGNAFDGSIFSVENQSAQVIDLSGQPTTSFGGVNLAGATLGQLFAIEDGIVDGIDVSGFGLVRLRATDVYVTPNSYFAPNTTSPSVQRGVDAASAGDTVQVENGVYVGQVLIGKDLTLAGESEAGVVIQADNALSSPFSAGSGAKNPVIFANAAAVMIQALTVDGNGQGDGYGDGFLGIAFYNAGGVVNDVTIEHIRNSPLNGVQNGVAMYANNADGAARALAVTNNNIFDYQKNGMVLSGANLALNVSGNTVTGAGPTAAIAQNGIQIGSGASGVVSGNTISGNEYTGPGSGADFFTQTQSGGILLFSAVTVSGNTIDDNDMGIYNNAVGSVISGNHLANGDYGVLEVQGSSTISGNTITGSGIGVYVLTFDGETGPPAAAIVDGNTISGAGVGLEASRQSAADPSVEVLAQNNSLVGNGEGAVISGGAAVDLGDTNSGANFSGLGADSVGNNLFSGYTGVGGNYAIDDQNLVAAGNPNVEAQQNDFGPVSDVSAIGQVVHDQADNPALTIVDYSQPLDLQGAPAVVYVNPSWVGTPIGTDPDGAGPATAYGVDAFSNIQDGVNAVASGGTVHVEDATYVQSDIVVGKAETIVGDSQAGVVVYPSVSNPLGSGGGSLNGGTNVFLIQASNVTIENLTVDGDNPNLTSGVVVGGADIDARNGIITDFNFGDITGLNVNHVTVENVYERGIEVANGVLATDTFDIEDNTIDNVQGDGGSIGIFNYGDSGTIAGNNVSNTGDAISANHSTGTAFTGNTITASASGIHTDNSGDSGFTNGFTQDVISGNSVSDGTANGYGVWVFAPYAPVSVHDNTITNVAIGLAEFGSGISGVPTITFDNNTVDAQGLTGAVGAYVSTTLLGFGDADADVVLSNNTIENALTGIYVEKTAPAVSPTVTISGGEITGNGTGIEIQGGSVSVSGVNFDGPVNTTDLLIDSGAGAVTLSNDQFAAATNYIDNESSSTVDATNGNTFGGIDPAAAGTTLSDLYGIEDHIKDGIDQAGLGLVRIKAANVYVAASSEAANSGAIQRGVTLASGGDTVNVQAGTFVGQVNITQDLSLIGGGQGNTIVQPGAVLTSQFSTGSGPKFAVIAADGATVTIQGLTVDGNGEGGAAGGNFVGIGYLNAGGTVDHVTIEHVRFTPLNGDQSGVGIYAFNLDGSPRALAVTNNDIFDYQKNGMALSGTGLTVDVENNTVTGAGPTPLIAQNGIQVGFGAGGLVENNTVSGDEYTGSGANGAGILLYSAAATTVSGDSVSASDVGVADYFSTGNVQINGDTITGSTGAGILVDQISGGPSAVTITGNTIEDGAGDSPANTGDGIDLFGDISGSTIENNLIQNNTGTGVYVDASVTDSSGPLAVNDNSISGNATAGVENDSAVTVDATNNWWGSANGPTAAGNTFNVGSQGDKIVGTGSTLYVPWLNSGHNNAVAAGFIPDGGASFAPVTNNLGGQFASIQAGIDGTPAGANTVSAVAGTFTENITIPGDVTVSGAGVGSTFIVPANAGNPVVTISGSGANAGHKLTLENFTISGGSSNVFFNSVGSDIALDNLALTNATAEAIEIHNSAALTDLSLDTVSASTNSLGIGFRMASTGAINGLSITNSDFDHDTYGFYSTGDSSSATGQNELTNVSISNSTFSNDVQRGIYVEKLDHATLDDITVADSGSVASTTGIDINLKYGNYTNITIENSQITNSGGANGFGLAIKGRNDGSNAGHLAGVSLVNDQIIGSPTDLYIDNDTTGVSFSGVELGGSGLGLSYGSPTLQTLALGDTTFDSTLGAYILNFSPNTIDATGATFGAVIPADNTLADLYAVEDKIVDAIDVPTFGLVRLRTGNVYVTPNSFAAPLTTSPSIQRGINAATAGDTVNVEAGTYSGDVNVNKVVTLSGAQAGVVAAGRSGGESIISSPDGTTELQISVSDATVDGFTIEGNTNVFVSGAGVFMTPGISGTHFVNNVVQNNVVGLFLANASGTDQAVIAGNLFQDNTNGGAAGGNDIYADQYTAGSTLTDVLIQNNSFTNSSFVVDSWGIGISNTSGGGFTNISVLNNTFTNSGRGMYFFDADQVTVSENNVSGATHYAVGLFGAVDTNFDIGQNTLDNNGSGIEIVAEEAATVDVTGISIHNNFIRGNSNDGVLVDSTATVTAGAIAINANNISGNAVAGLEDDTSAAVDAADNWWGSATGPNSTGNPTGTGDAVVSLFGDMPIIAPWLTSGVDADADATDGFQPSAGLAVDISGVSTIDEGATYTLSLNPSSPGSADITSWFITWGDGSPAQFVSGNPASVTHDYVDGPNDYTISATAATVFGAAVSNDVSVHVNNVAPANLVLTPSATDIDENGSISLDGSFTDPGAADTETVDISWGDGSADTIFVLPAGVDTFSGQTHQYLDNPAGQPNGSFTLGVTVTDKDGASTSNSTAIEVDNVAPSTPTISLSSSQISENGTVMVSGGFTDPGTLDTHTVDVSWGDGSADTILNLPAGVLTYSAGSHQYLDNPAGQPTGSFTVSVSVTDKDGASSSNSTPVEVDNVAPSNLALNAVPSTIDEGSSTTLSGTFVDPGTLDTHTVTIDWGDGSPNTILTPGAGVLSFTAPAHTYVNNLAGNAPYTISVTVTDKDGGTVSNSTNVTVNDVAPTVSLSGSKSDNANPTPNDAEGSTFTLTLSPVNDPGYPSDQVQDYFINWGDGSSIQMITAASLPETSGGTVTHVYPDGVVPPGTTNPTDTIQVDILDNDGYHAAAGTLGVVVYNLPPTAGFNGSASVAEGSSANVTFFGQTDPSSVDVAAGFTYSYDFDNNGTFEVTGSSSSNVTVPASFLSTPGTVTVRGRITDKDGGFTDYTHMITVTNVAPTVNAITDKVVGVNTPLTVNGSFIDPGSDSPWLVYVNYDEVNHPGLGTLIQSSGSKNFTLNNTYAATGVYTVQVTVEDLNGAGPFTLSGTTSFGVTVNPTTFQVTNFTQEASGFDVQFNRAADLAVLNLYKGLTNTYGAADLTLVGNSTGNVLGSLVWDPSTNTARFIKTGGVLAPDTYTVTLRSASDAWQDASNNLLDGDANDVAGGDYTMSFVVGSAGDVVALPDFARGPGQPVNVPATASSGIPIAISDGNGVTAVDFDLIYNPNLLDISNVALAAGLPAGWGVTFNNSVAGDLQVSVSGISTLAAGPNTLVNITATVPLAATYGAAGAMQITSLRINEGAITGSGDEAVEKVVLIGNASGSGTYEPLDAHFISNVVVNNASGFDAFPLTDPRIVGDVTGDGTLSGQDASDVAQEVVDLPVPQIPPLAGGYVPPAGPPAAGVDPLVSIPTGVLGNPGESVTVPLNIDDATLVASGLFPLVYDTSELTLTGASLGTLDASNWSIVFNPANGKVAFFNNGDTAPPPGAGSIANVTFTIAANAPVGLTPVSIAGGNLMSDTGSLPLSTTAGSIDVETPTVGNFIVDDGTAQRSMVRSLTVVFREPVTLSAGAMTLSLRDPMGGPSTPQTFTLSNPSADQKTYILTFTGPGYTGGSLNDGVYDLVVHAGLVQDGGGNQPGSDETFSFYRLYGDYFGEGTVGFDDLVLLAQDFDVVSPQPQYQSFMDIDGDGTIGFPELVKLAQNFDESLSVSSVGPAPVAVVLSPAGQKGTAVVNPAYTPASGAASTASTDGSGIDSILGSGGEDSLLE